jgi:probable metal-binding protein
MKTINEVHGHVVMKMMIEAKKSFTKEELEKAIIEKFGKETKFHTCSAEGMDAKEIIDFLENKGKFISTVEGIKTNPDKICNHE